MGASRLILAVRSLDSGHDAKLDIEAVTKCATDVVQVWQIDMASYSSVLTFAERIKDELDRVDCFVANAALAKGIYSMAEDNETTITVNVISTFLLMLLVLPKLKSTASKFHVRPVFTIVSSGAYNLTTFPQKSAPEGELLATINDRATMEKYLSQQYAVSKLLGIFLLREFAERHPASIFPVTVNAVNPGFCKSSLARELKGILAAVFTFMEFFLARSTEVGSRTLVNAAAAGAETHGKFLDNGQVKELSLLVTSNEGRVLQERVTAEVLKKLEAIKPGVTEEF